MALGRHSTCQRHVTSTISRDGHPNITLGAYDAWQITPENR